MSKALVDILGRLDGDMLALQGMGSRLQPPLEDRPLTMEQEAAPKPPPFKVKKEDYDHVKKLLEEIAGLAKSASEEIDKELKVPPPPEAESSPSSANQAASKESAGAHKK